MADMESRVERLEDDVYRTHPENPGALVRLDRIERLLSVMLKVGVVVGGMGLVWKALEVIGSVIERTISG